MNRRRVREDEAVQVPQSVDDPAAVERDGDLSRLDKISWSSIVSWGNSIFFQGGSWPEKLTKLEYHIKLLICLLMLPEESFNFVG